MENIFGFNVGRDYYMFHIDAAIVQAMYAHEMSFGPSTYKNGLKVGYSVGKMQLVLDMATMHAQEYNVLVRD